MPMSYQTLSNLSGRGLEGELLLQGLRLCSIILQCSVYNDIRWDIIAVLMLF